MTFEQLYRNECDSIRLLIEEFNHVAAEYIVKNMDAINAIQARDWNEYVPPKAIPNIIGYLSSSLLVHTISLLEYRLPILVNHYFKQREIELKEPFGTFGRGNILTRLETLINSVDGITIDFEDALIRRLHAWIRVRNDDVHNGGYRGSVITDEQIELLPGVRAGTFDQLYDLQFGACHILVNDVEAFFLRVDKALKPEMSS